jgi:hypothetical protein
MSGIIGHTMFGVLGLKAAAQRKLPVAPIAGRHMASYLAGAYLGCDIQTMPEAVCVETGREVGYGTVPIKKSPITGGAVRPWVLRHGELSFTPREIHDRFYGRSHLVFGWIRESQELRIPWDHLPDYFADVVEDLSDLYGPGERPLAYLLGWIAHVVSDSLIKSVQPGIDLHLLDGKYTPRNRPIQDLIMFHEVGLKELRLDWAAYFADLVATPVEPIQFHYMRIAEPRGRLGKTFSHGWQPQQRELLQAVLVENRRWCRQHALDMLDAVRLVRDANGALDCNEAARTLTGLNYSQMVEAAEGANLRHALWQMGEAIADMFAAVVQRSPGFAGLPVDESPDWESLTRRWRR